MPGGRSEERVPSVFRQLAADVRNVAWLLNDYLREADVTVAGSLAASEYGQESLYSDEQVADPVFHVIVRAQHGLVAAVDHMGGLAACIEADDVVLASLSLLRPIVTAAGMTYYLLDPDIGIRERLRRGWNFELDSVREQLNGVDKDQMPELWEHLAVTRYRYLTWGRRHGYTKQERRERFGERRYWFADGDLAGPPPSELRLADDVLAAIGDGGMGRAVYRFSSSFIHAQAHAFSILQPAAGQRDSQTPNMVPLGVTPGDLTTWVMVATMAVHTSAARCGQYFGWDLASWVGTVYPIMERWAHALGD